MHVEEYVGIRVKELCKSHGISNYRLAQLAGVDQSMIGDIIERGSIPTLPTLEKICNAFEISMAVFFEQEYGNLELTVEQKEIVGAWNGLDVEKRKVLMSVVRTLKNL